MGDRQHSSLTTSLSEWRGLGGSYDLAPSQALVGRHLALTYPYRCVFGRATLEIDKGVFCPTLTNASPLLLDAITNYNGARVLDAFAGSGAFGINAALAGAACVVSVDVSRLAAICIRRNAVRNYVADKVEVREGTVSGSVKDTDSFDLIIANPPLLPGDQSGILGSALFDPELRANVDFIRSLGTYLAPDGRCYLLSSDVFERYGPGVERLCAEVGLDSSVVAKLDVGYEQYRVHCVRRGES